MWGISWQAEDLLASQEGLCSMELVSWFIMRNFTFHYLSKLVIGIQSRVTDCGALRHDTVPIGRLVQTFRRNIYL
jgi:hypothetical protein